ncbi:MAG: hypothetical protein JWO38_470 [Gemmataceae bacterium]|nr:hypothetical protein [Gemmataceae bacterium]
MSEPAAAPGPRFTLRQLPFPAKLVLTCFLLTVGLGYTSAMIQLHMQHSDRDGNVLPTKDNVIAVFAGKMRDTGARKVKSRLEAIIDGPEKGGLTGSNMAPAFFDKDDADFRKIAKDHPEQLAQLNAERDGERRALIAWVNAAPEARQKAYDEDRFALPAELAAQPFSDAYRDKGQQGVAKVRSILRDRCVRCHKPGGEKSEIPFTTYEELSKFLPAVAAVQMGGGYVDSGRQISLEKLTQSTHAHLLSFAVLFTLTGLTFAFTSYPGIIRGFLGPVVLVAQAADVSCWWLARLPDSGPFFASCIIATGGIVGLGLVAQIILSLFNMYGPKGKVVLALMFIFAGCLGGMAYVEVIDPHLREEKQKAALKAEADKKKAEEDKGGIAPKPNENPPPKNGAANPPVVPTGPSKLERLLTGPWEKGPWGMDKAINGVPDGGMVRAFFDKETVFKDALKEKDPELPQLIAQREGERATVLAWINTLPGPRKQAFEEDRFPLPPPLIGKPVTAEFKADDKAVKVKSLFEARCWSCHGGENKIPLDGYEKLEKFLAPMAK